MKGDKKVIEYLNQALRNELTAINQYFLHAKILMHKGYETLGKKEYEESIDEMHHADKLSQRILYLGGLPNFQDLGKLMIGETVKEIIEADFKLEVEAIPHLQEAIAYAEEVKDYGSVELLSEILVSEEGHYDWLNKQLKLISEIGEQNYLQSQV